MRSLLIAALLLLALAAPALAKQKAKTTVVDDAPLRYGMDLDAATKVVSDPAMWHIAYRVDTASTADFAAVWSGEVYYHVRFLNGKCCYIEKRAEVGPEEVDQLLQMYRAVYGDSPEATSSHNGQLIFSRWQKPDREVTISAVGHQGKYKLFYEEFDPVGVGDVRVAQERELGQEAESDPLTGKLRINPLGQAAEVDEQQAAPDDSSADSTATDDSGDSASADDQPATGDTDKKADDKPAKGKGKRRSHPKTDPVTGDGG